MEIKINAAKIVLLAMRDARARIDEIFLFNLKLNLFCLLLKIEIGTRRLYSSITYSSSRLRLLIGGKFVLCLKLICFESFPSFLHLNVLQMNLGRLSSTSVSLSFSLSMYRSLVAFNLISRSWGLLEVAMKQFELLILGFFRSFQGNPW